MKVLALFSGLWLGACSVFGIRTVAEPAYAVLERLGPVEVRQYAPLVAAETTVYGDETTARSTGFRRLAGYIFGSNHARASIAMTAPVTQQAAPGGQEAIAMTAPVAQARGPGAGLAAGWTIRFMMPAGRDLASLPAPDDPTVRLVGLPAETYAVLRFAGLAPAATLAAREAELRAALAASAWTLRGPPVVWFYDPPWTLPPLRRTEVAIPVAPR